MKRYKATKEMVGHGVAINGQSAVLGSKKDGEQSYLWSKRFVTMAIQQDW